MHVSDTSLALVFGLGAIHGVNPAMGWLFAVSLGLQERRRRSVWVALGPLAAGHALAIGATLAVAGALGLVVPIAALKVLAALLLVGFGLSQLRRHRHPRRGGMRVGVGELTIWSFMMASAHGAGLMLLPLVLRTPDPVTAGGLEAAGHMGRPLTAGLSAGASAGLAAALVHTAGYLLVAGLLAAAIYEKLGLRLLRTAWINLDAIWAVALFLTGVLTFVL